MRCSRRSGVRYACWAAVWGGVLVWPLPCALLAVAGYLWGRAGQARPGRRMEHSIGCGGFVSIVMLPSADELARQSELCLELSCWAVTT
jgi:hypothetical protein